MKFPLFCSHTLSRAPLYFQLVGFLKQIVRCDAGKFEKDTERGGDLTQWTQVRRYEWCKNGIFTTWLEREEGIWQGWILIGFTQCAPMHCFLCNGAHSGNNSSVFCYIITVIDSSCLQCPWSNSNIFFFLTRFLMFEPFGALHSWTRTVSVPNTG